MKILIVEVNWLGDVLFTTPAIKALRKKFKDSFIACLIHPRTKDILEGNPNIDEFIVNDEDAKYKGFLGKSKLVSELKRYKFDLALLFHRSFTRAAITYFAGIHRRVGYGAFKRKLILTDSIPSPKKDSQHRIDYYLRIVEHLGCSIEDRLYEFFTSQDDERFIEEFLRSQQVKKEDFIVCLNPGGNWQPKRWPKENFSLLADRLIDDFGVKIIFSGSKGDSALIDDIVRGMKHRPIPRDKGPIIAAGKTNLKQLACLFVNSDLVISGDSGPLHIAAAVGSDIIALFGPTSPSVTGPLGRGRIRIIRKPIDCAVPCYNKDCRDNLCMKEITVEDVLEQVRSLRSS